MWFKEFLRCPDCGSDFIWTEIVHCVNCEFQSPTGKQLILKPIHPTKVHLTFSRHLPDITLLSHLNLQDRHFSIEGLAVPKI